MISKHKNIEPIPNNPFKNCKLNREKYADTLTTLISNSYEGFVLAINNPWGTGKTTFVKMWQAQLKLKGFKTLYFNAWENDLFTDPTIAILGELKQLMNIENEENFKEILSTIATIGKNMLPVIGKHLIRRYGGEELSELIEANLKACTELFEKDVEEYSKRVATIQEFKKLLSEFIRVNSPDKPIVFIVDELDRCKPDYAVEVLEKIKHFFTVEGIIFVLSIDKISLCESVKGFYRSQCINAEEYLKRFIDIEYKLPAPDIDHFCDYLYEYLNFEKVFKNEDRLRLFSGKGESVVFLKFSKALNKLENLTLRQIEKLYSHFRTTIIFFSNNEPIDPGLLYFLIYLRQQNPDTYNKIISKTYTIQDLIDNMYYFTDNMSNNSDAYSITIKLLVYYGSYLNTPYVKDKLLDDNCEKLLFETKYDPQKLKNSIIKIRENYGYEDTLSFLINKIELYNNFQF